MHRRTTDIRDARRRSSVHGVPELPEVETIRRQLAASVVGAQVAGAEAHPSPKFREAPLVVGTRLTDVTRRGKYLLFATDDDREMVVHLGMTGRFTITPPGGPATPRDALWRRARWDFRDGRTLDLVDQRRFGRVAVVPTGQHERLPTLATMGPEPFDPAFTPTRLYEDLATGRRRVKTALLSQRVVAGIGNIYADEALWRARISPLARHVGPERAARLHTAVVDVLAEAILHGGTRLRDYRSVAGDTGEHQWHLDCYGRAGEPCRHCRTPLTHRVVDGRGITWCPRCQAR